MKNLYIMISKTETGIGRMLRRFGGLTYNHVSLSLDEELTRLYSFARSERYGFLTGTIVHETTDRYVLGAEDGVPVEIFRIPVTDEQYELACARVREILDDKEYMYNLLSVAVTPIFGGFSTYKAYSCIEFVMSILSSMEVIEMELPLYEYRPDDLELMLSEYVYYKGDLLEYIPFETSDADFFKPISLDLVRRSAIALAVISYRSARAVLHRRMTGHGAV